jgi:hypothetical protein
MSKPLIVGLPDGRLTDINRPIFNLPKPKQASQR